MPNCLQFRLSFLFLLVVLGTSSCIYTDETPPEVRDFTVNFRDRYVGITVPDTLTIRGLYTDEASLGGITATLVPLAEVAEGSRIQPTYGSLDTVFIYGGISVEAAAQIPIGAQRFAQGSYTLTSSFFDAEGNMGTENGVQVHVFNPFPHIQLFNIASDSIALTGNNPLEIIGEVTDYTDQLESVRLLVRRKTLNEETGRFTVAQEASFDTTFVLGDRQFSFSFSETFLPDSIGDFRFSILATDSLSLQTNMVTEVRFY